MPRIGYFELALDDPERAARFYSEVFGWNIQKWSGPKEYWLIETGPESEHGINGGMMRYREGMPRAFNTIMVDSVDVYLEKAKQAGATVALEKMAIPGIGYQAYINDPEGNMIGLHQVDPKAG
jgi:predicted enzyme related to lactoylglutathione lyase